MGQYCWTHLRIWLVVFRVPTICMRNLGERFWVEGNGQAAEYTKKLGSRQISQQDRPAPRQLPLQHSPNPFLCSCKQTPSLIRRSSPSSQPQKVQTRSKHDLCCFFPQPSPSPQPLRSTRFPPHPTFLCTCPFIFGCFSSLYSRLPKSQFTEPRKGTWPRAYCREHQRRSSSFMTRGAPICMIRHRLT